jgi:hypothetical protein
MYLDPASGKKKEVLKSVRARSAIVVVGVDVLGRMLVLDTWADRVGTTQIVKSFLDMFELWSPGVKVAGFEDVGQQHLLFDPLLQEAKNREVDLPLVPVKVPTGIDKLFRIRSTLNPLIAQGKLIFMEHQLDLLNEVTSFPMSSLKDLVDSLASCLALVPNKYEKRQEWSEDRAYVEYLRESGWSQQEIEVAMPNVDPKNWLEKLKSSKNRAIGG